MVHSRQKDKWIVYTLAILLCLVLVSFWLMCNLYAKYTAEASGGDTARVALWGSHQSITLAEGDKLPQSPGESCTYTVIISNERNSKISETAQKYSIEVITSGNLPLTYKISKEDVDVGSFLETSENKTWKISNNNMVFAAGIAGTHTYKLTVTWPDNEKSANLASVPDFIQIKICTEQVD